MSTMLEQAIIDAGALKEAAIKNAEAAVIEKYSVDIKEAVDSLLEEDELELGEAEDDLGLGGDLGGMGMGDEAGDVLPDITPAATDGENLCPCPDEQEEVIVDFEQLAAAADAESGLDPLAPGSEPEFPGAEEAGLDSELGLDDEEEDEEFELSEKMIDNVIDEILKVDHEARPSGTVGGHASNPTEEEAEGDAILAKARDTEEVELNKTKEKAIKDLQERATKLAKNNAILRENRDKYMKVINHLKVKVNETNLSNAKLLYTNKILNSGSLNERQKNKLAEAISRAKTVEEARVIFQTLQSAVESGRTKRQPKSLSEAVAKRTSAFMPRRTQNLQETKNPEVDRWAILAGIKDK